MVFLVTVSKPLAWIYVMILINLKTSHPCFLLFFFFLARCAFLSLFFFSIVVNYLGGFRVSEIMGERSLVFPRESWVRHSAQLTPTVALTS